MIVDCKARADEILQMAKGRHGNLAIIQVGNDPRSNVYVRGKVKDCQKIGIECEVFKLASSAEEYEVEDIIDNLNRDRSFTGIIVQLPLPGNLDEDYLCRQIIPNKDVDGFGPDSIYNPCTPEGIVWLLKQLHGSLRGAEAVIVGRGKLVGAPLKDMLLDQDATVTVCHSHTRNLREYTKRADIVVLATGKHIFDQSYFRTSLGRQTVIDAGITFDENGKLCGDLIADQVDHSNMNITPVPGGVGLLTRAVLVAHTAGVRLI